MARRARSSRSKDGKASGVGAKKEAKAPVSGSPSTDQTTKTTRVQAAQAPKTSFSQWLNSNQGTILVLMGIFLLAILVRALFYYQFSFEIWPPRVVGNDPSYHLRVIQFVQDEGRHITLDPLLNYPLSGGNPRPPIFDWSIALLGIVLSPFFGFHVTNATWYAFQISPAVWGALTIFPAYLLGKEMFGKKAGMVGAFLLAITASHIERSTLGFADHDSFIVFFLVLSIYFLARSFSKQEDRNYIEDWRRPESVILGFRSFFSSNKQAIGYAVLSGICLTTIALTWQGFAYILAILLIYFLIQLMIQRFRNEDSLGTFVILFIVMAMAPLLSLPYYFVFSIATWSQGFYILLAMVFMGFFIVPTRDMPWLIVIPTLGIVLAVAYAILTLSFPATADMLFTGGGYFVKSKLYSTIAEAQAPDLSRLIFTYGPATFFLGLIGVVMAVINLPKHLKKDYILVVVWTAVAIFMAMRAVRFTFNATPAFTLLAGWVLIELVRFFKAEGLSIVYSILAVLIFFGMMGIVYEGWDDFFSRNYLALTILPITLISVGYVAYMKYRKHRDNYKFRTVLAALFVGFLVVFPSVLFAADASIPYEKKRDFDEELSVLGTFGSSFHSDYWADSYDWMAKQDIIVDGQRTRPEERPAFMSWWDYGFDQIVMGEHPTAADNFQNGYQFTGSMIASPSEEESIALMVARVLEGDWVKNKRKGFSDDVWETLTEHLGDDRNSTMGPYELVRIYRNPSSYINKIERDPSLYGRYEDITTQNALYAAAKVILMKNGKEGVVDLYKDLIDDTGWSLRYFAVDYRLFPFSSSNTGIFYAPIKLADRNIDDYLEYRAYAQENTQGSNDNPIWVDYPDNPITMEKAQAESERLGYKFRITNYDMFYTDAFYNSMFYRAYIGYSPMDVGSGNDGKTIPGFGMGGVGNLPPMQAWNMTHWKLVYRTMYYSEKDEKNATFPDDYRPMESNEAIEIYQKEGGDLKSGLGQGVFYIKYYHGAILEGRVMTERGRPSAGVRVTVLDDFGIPHGNVLTDDEGRYSLIAPPGEITMVVSDGDLNNMYDMVYQFQLDQSTNQPSLGLNVTTLTISDDLAMRRVDDGKMEMDFIIPGKTMFGTVYRDLDSDGSYKEGEDSEVTRGNITFRAATSSLVIGPVAIDENGGYSIEDVVPGTYSVEYSDGPDVITILNNFKIDPKTESTRDLKIENIIVRGQVNLDGSPIVNISVVLKKGDEVLNATISDPSGNFSMGRILPGTYHVVVDDPRFMHDTVKLYLDQGDDRFVNITLDRKGRLDLKAYSTLTSTSIKDRRAPAGGALVYIHDHSNASISWTYSLDRFGELSVDLPIGMYDLRIVQIERGQYEVHMQGLRIEWERTNKIAADLVKGYRINGSATKLAGTPLKGAYVMFERPDGVRAYAMVDHSSRYEVIVPLSDYKVIVDNMTKTGGVHYFHMQDLSKNDIRGATRLDLWVEHTIDVTGRVYWDKDLDGVFTSPEEAYEKNSYEGGKIASEVAIAGVTVKFEYANGTIEFATVEEGIYRARLPSGDYTMTVESAGFETFRMHVPVDDTVANRNFGINDTDAPLRSQPRDFELNLSYAYLGLTEERFGNVGPISVTLVAQELYMEGQEFIFIADENGRVREQLYPAEYDVIINWASEINALEHHIQKSHLFFLEPGTPLWKEDIVAEKFVTLRGRVNLIENNLIKSPAELTLSFTPVEGVGHSIGTAMTDFNGEFEAYLPTGKYVIEAHEQRSATHFMILRDIMLDESTTPLTIYMEEGYPVKGRITNAFNGIQDSQVQFRKGDVWALTGVMEDGTFELFVPPSEYEIRYRFITSERIAGEDTETHYIKDASLNVEGPVSDFEMSVDRLYKIHGTVYHDISEDRTIQPEERKAFAELTFISTSGEYESINITADANGDYIALLFVDEYELTVNVTDYMPMPRDGYGIVDLTQEQVLWDIQLEPVPNRIFVSVVDEENSPVIGMQFTIRDSLDGNIVHTGTTDELGYLDMVVPPGLYNVFGMRYSGGQPSHGYMGRIDLDVAEGVEGEWKAVAAKRLFGTVFYKDTDKVLHKDLTSGKDLVWTHKETRSEIEVPYNTGTYQIDLPYGTYEVGGSINTQEYGVEMDYFASKTVNVNSEIDARDLAIEFQKNKLHTFRIDLVREWEHELLLAPGSTVQLEYFIESTGNEPVTVSVEAEDKPVDWIVEFPYGRDVHIPIGGRELRKMNITVPSFPDWSNSILVQGKAETGSTNKFQVDVTTPPSYGFSLGFDRPPKVGMGFGDQIIFNLSVENLGTGEDMVNIRMSPPMDRISGWYIEWEGENEFPAHGANASLSPTGQRRFAITLRAPPESLSLEGESLTLTFTGTNRGGDKDPASITFEINRPNLVLPPGFIKLTNRKLDDPVLNRTIEANITVGSMHRASSAVNVTLFINGREAAYGIIPSIPQDGYASTKLRFNVTDLNLTENDYHSIQVMVDPENRIRESNEYDNVAGWDNVVIGHIEEKTYVNWRIVVFITLILLIAVAIIAYKQRTEPI
ncbi:MAG: carboxypeptidase regulatory-like domain-containing protein [Candidatus Thermoplasmatota archaeon]|nr:carboxypeptidase regulatory-like domain-containing protein [Candidatus Thermoplasmatota archaeon]